MKLDPKARPGILAGRNKKPEQDADPRGKKPKQVVVKCDMCSDFRQMACEYTCPTGAMQVLTPEDLIEAYNQEK